ncbi:MULTISPECIES: Rha family transcriptional regulator [unclassified Brucella]|uniref:Rha family transcriptional regulator n=1 Tax=unclassified Brucella TaxID=2632610 RepID=UPI0015DDFE2A|nr:MULTISPECIES: Rha family transcriptional regulator [unclassified Brucella]
MTIHSSSITAAQPIVSVKDGKVFANSRDVAEFFGKRHDNVLRDIRNLDMPSDLRVSMFRPTVLHDKYGRELDAFDMTRDGFTFLAMGFTGKKALQFKLQYIEASTEWKPSSRQRSRFRQTTTASSWNWSVNRRKPTGSIGETLQAAFNGLKIP